MLLNRIRFVRMCLASQDHIYTAAFNMHPLDYWHLYEKRGGGFINRSGVLRTEGRDISIVHSITVYRISSILYSPYTVIFTGMPVERQSKKVAENSPDQLDGDTSYVC